MFCQRYYLNGRISLPSSEGVFVSLFSQVADTCNLMFNIDHLLLNHITEEHQPRRH
jgi:hypothetical protein